MSITSISTKVLAGTLAIIALSGVGVYAATSTTVSKDIENVKTALTNNDFTAYKQARIQVATDRINEMTQEEFDKHAKMFASMQKYQTALDDAVKNNDFNAFKTVHSEMQKEREANKPADSNRPNRPEPTEAQLQERFNQMVASYKADGTLPSQKVFEGGREGRGGKGGMKGGMDREL
jgi:uncharacterized phage infection (PIP) family protein YhgE